MRKLTNLLKSAALAALVLTAFQGFGKTFTGSIDSDWTKNGNWNPSGVPGGGSAVVIDADCVIPGSASYTISSLTVNGSYTLDIANASLYVINNIVNNGTLELGNDGGLYQGGSFSGSGDVSVYKNGHSDDRWNYWSAPLANQAIIDLRYSNYTIFTSVAGGAPEWAANEKWNNYHAQQVETWWENVTHSGANMARGRGYIAARVGTHHFSGSASDVWDGSFSGISISSGGNFFLVGNPYISGLDLGTFVADNSGIIGNTIYSWAQGTAQTNWLTGQTEDYGYYNTGTATGVAGSGDLASSSVPGGRIAVAQSFMVEGTGNGNIAFNNTQRGDGVAFMKKTSDVARFNMLSPNGKFSQINFTFMHDQIDENDKTFRSVRKHVGPGGVRLYSMYNGEECAIVGLNQLEGARTFEIRVDANEAGKYQIALQEMPGLEGVDITLEDRKLGTFHTMNTKEAYAFTAQKHEVLEGRFFITFRKSGSSVEELNVSSTLKVFAANSQIVVDRSANVVDIKSVNVYDVAGKMVASYNNVGTSSIINLPFNGSKGVYVVAVETANGTKTSKIFNN